MSQLWLPLQSTLTQHTDAVTDLSLHAKGKYLASMSADATFCIWDIQEAQCMAQVGASPFAWAGPSVSKSFAFNI